MQGPTRKALDALRVRTLISATLLALIAAAIAPEDSRATEELRADLFFGVKALARDEWEPTERQREFGLVLHWTPGGWPVGVRGSFLAARDSASAAGTRHEVRVYEGGLGLGRIWSEWGAVQPFLGVGGGLARVDAERSGLGTPARDRGNLVRAGWIETGIYLKASRGLSLGLLGRYTKGNDVSLFGSLRDPGGLHFGLLLGWQALP